MLKYLFSLILLLFFIGCSDDNDDEANTSSDYDGTWNVTFMGDYANADCSGEVDSEGWTMAVAFGFSQSLEIDGDTYTMTVSMMGESETISGDFSETDGNPCLDGECISINWITPGSVWSMDVERDAYCDDFDGNETDDIDQESCEANGPGYDWWEAYCTQATYTKQ